MDDWSGNGGRGSLRPRAVGEILSAAFDLYKRHWQALVTIVAIVAVPLTLLQTFIADRIATQAAQIRVKNGVVQSVPTDLWRTVAGVLLVALITVLVVQILTGAITRAAAGSLLGEELTVDAAYRFGLARLGSILLVGILVGLAVFAGVLLFVIPGIFIAVRLTVSLPALVVEGKRGRAAISRSWELVRGHGWPVFGAILVAGIISGIVSSLVTAPFSGSWAARGLAAAFASVITQPFTTLVVVLIYLDLRVRKEQLDLATLRRDLEASAP